MEFWIRMLKEDEQDRCPKKNSDKRCTYPPCQMKGHEIDDCRKLKSDNKAMPKKGEKRKCHK